MAKLIARQIQDMDAANKAPRCQHIKANGVRCASPAMRELPFCFFHEKFYNPPYDDSFPPLEDANSVQCAILQVLNGLKSKLIGPTEARIMLYGLKAASINSRRTTFEPIMQAQVTEYPGSRRQQSDCVTPDLRSAGAHVTPDLRSGAADPRSAVTQSPSASSASPAASSTEFDCHPERGKAKSRDHASDMQDFLRAVKEQSSYTAKKPAASAPSTEVIPSEARRGERAEGSALTSN